MDKVMVTRYSSNPPHRPIVVNGIIYDRWINVESGERMVWINSEKRWRKEFAELRTNRKK